MMISTRGRYALRVMIDLAENTSDKYIPMKEVAERQKLSLKYLERILPSLVKGGFVEGVQGKFGGYKLVKAPEDCIVGDILRTTEGDLAPVSCLECGCEPCGNANGCRTRPVWVGLQNVITEYLDSVTLADLMEK